MHQPKVSVRNIRSNRSNILLRKLNIKTYWIYITYVFVELISYVSIVDLKIVSTNACKFSGKRNHKMSLTVQQIILDAKKLVIRISDHENAANNLISDMESVHSQIDNMKQYQEAVDILNTEAKQTPHVQLITGIQRENRHLLEIHAENKELRNALEDHQNALELIMSKYRQQIASLMRLSKTDSSSLHNTKYANIITRQAEKINEMAAVMKTAASLDEEKECKEMEAFHCLKKENDGLREVLNIANKFGSLSKEITVENKTIQTDPL